MARLGRDFYVHLRDWLVETELERYRSGRVFEYMWPVLFGEPPVQAPAEARPQCSSLLHKDCMAYHAAHLASP